MVHLAPYAVAITKSLSWHGRTEQFANVYHYDFGVGGPSEAESGALIDALVVEEKKVYTSGVTFVNGRVWGPTDQGPAQSETRFIKDLSGAGTMLANSPIYRECAIVVQLYLGRATGTGRKRFLRKYIRSTALPASSSGQFGDTPIGTANKAVYVTYGNAIKTLNVGTGNVDICAPDGDHLPLGTSPTVLDYLTMHQFRN